MNRISVLVVDDEQDCRDGLKQIVPWNDYGVDEILEARNGQEGLELAMQYEPQLILTDIIMPHMNGVELMKALEQRRWSGSIIVVTAHDDFQFAREALRLGAVDYILKPFRRHEVLFSVGQCIENIKLEQIHKLQANEEKATYTEALELLQDKTISELLTSRRTDWSYFKKRIQQVQLGWMLEQPLITLIVEVDNLGSILQGKTDSEKYLLQFAIGNVAKESIPSSLPFYLWRAPASSRWLVIIATNDKELIGRTSDIMISNIGTYVKHSVSIGVGSVCDFERLPYSYTAALETLAYRTLLGGNQTLFSDEVMLLQPSHVLQETPLEQEILSVLKAGLPDQINRFHPSFTELVQTWGEKDLESLHKRLFEWILRMERGMRSTFPKINVVGDNTFLIWKTFQGFDTLEGNIRYTLDLLIEMATIAQQWQQKQLSQISRKALQLIDTEYASALTVAEVADRVYVSPVWLGHVLKQDTGHTFLELLTERRMKRAKELLSNVALKTYEIAELVGYRDTDYFTKIFKKHVGMTPSEYRNTTV